MASDDHSAGGSERCTIAGCERKQSSRRWAVLDKQEIDGSKEAVPLNLCAPCTRAFDAAKDGIYRYDGAESDPSGGEDGAE